MSEKRPLSPFMIGPYYRPQITSMMSIAHRVSGVVLAVGSLALVWFLLSLSMGPEAFASTQACLSSRFGQLVLFAFSLCLMYHFFNGLRHLFWDAGKGFEIGTVYRSGYAVLALTVLATAALWWFARMSGGVA
jgi:succinate dehydrogenase / fumarate reductase cytochrome b subunit